MDRDELSKFVSRQIAEALPEGFVEECICDAIEKEIVNFKVDEYSIREVLKLIIVEKTKELLRTRYTAQIEAKADELAQRALVAR